MSRNKSCESLVLTKSALPSSSADTMVLLSIKALVQSLLQWSFVKVAAWTVFIKRSRSLEAGLEKRFWGRWQRESSMVLPISTVIRLFTEVGPPGLEVSIADCSQISNHPTSCFAGTAKSNSAISECLENLAPKETQTPLLVHHTIWLQNASLVNPTQSLPMSGHWASPSWKWPNIDFHFLQTARKCSLELA
jgi:hypothetical protein